MPHPRPGRQLREKSVIQHEPLKAVDHLAPKLQTTGASAVLGGVILGWLVSKLGFVRLANSVTRCKT